MRRTNRKTGARPAPHPLDAIDRRLLALLVRDGRMSYQALAGAVGLSRPAAMERVRRLEQHGFITGYGAHLNRDQLGHGVTAFVAVRYGHTRHLGDEPRMRQLATHPGVLECHHVAGDDCYMLKVVARDLTGVQEILRALAAGQQSLSTRTTIVLSTVFEKPGLVPEESD